MNQIPTTFILGHRTTLGPRTWVTPNLVLGTPEKLKGLDSGGLLLHKGSQKGGCQGDCPMGATQVMLGKHLRLSLMGVFIGIRITGNNTCKGATIATAAIP